MNRPTLSHEFSVSDKGAIFSSAHTNHYIIVIRTIFHSDFIKTNISYG